MNASHPFWKVCFYILIFVSLALLFMAHHYGWLTATPPGEPPSQPSPPAVTSDVWTSDKYLDAPTPQDTLEDFIRFEPFLTWKPGKLVLAEGSVAPPSPNFVYLATIVKVVDGDTVDVMVDLGFSVHTKQRIRLANVFAEERGKGDGSGTAQTENLLKLVPVGSSVTIATSKDATDKYGRYVGTLWTTNRVNVNVAQQEFIGSPQGKGVK